MGVGVRLHATLPFAETGARQQSLSTVVSMGACNETGEMDITGNV
jgi:hypothetical protein